MSAAAPDEILNFWIGRASDDAHAAKEKNTLWFVKSEETDARIAARFMGSVEALADGLAWVWAKQSPRARLAAIVALDQFPRNIWRETPRAFAYDDEALALCKDGLLTDQDKHFKEVERQFFYLPLEHSERLADQTLGLDQFKRLVDDARAPFKPLCQEACDYARRHFEVIERFGRFPHRNAILGRETTDEEAEFLKQPGARF